MASSSASFSSGQSSSTSTPTVIQTPQTEFSLQLSQLLQQLGMQQQNWASQQFAQTSAVTDAQINNFIQQANQGAGLAGSMLNDYENVFAPMQDQYATNAGSYASEGRIRNEMGMAESTAMQAGNQAKANAEQELQSFGIDPSSGRYQDLIRASDTANAAAAAGAGETARLNTEQQGQQRLINAIEMGQQLPGNAVNALNSTYQGISGAENAALGNANTGVALTTSPNQFLSTAQGVKVPPVGNTSQSQSSQGSTSGSVNPGGGAGGSKSSDPFNMNRFGTTPSGGGGGSSGLGPNPNANKTATPQYMQNPYPQISSIGGGGAQYDIGDPSSLGGYDPYNPYSNLDPTTSGVGEDLSNNGWMGGDYYDPNAGNWSQDFTNGSTYTGDLTPPAYDPTWGAGDSGYDSGSDYGYSPSYSGGDSSWDTSGWDNSGGGGDLGSWDTSSTQDWGGGGYDSSWGGDSGGGDYSDYSDYGDMGYARGGAVRPPQRPQQRPMIPPGGGHVPAQMSPSGGRKVDDIRAVIPQTGGQARLNANEFVIPRDVAMWKGQEFFQKMIAQARKARMGAPAKPQRG